MGDDTQAVVFAGGKPLGVEYSDIDAGYEADCYEEWYVACCFLF
jgi:hypothetical protein